MPNSNREADKATIAEIAQAVGLSEHCDLDPPVSAGSVGRSESSAPYRTTNHVIKSKQHIFKRFVSDIGFKTELAVYRQRSRWKFAIPALLGELSDRRLGHWLVLERVSGRPLLDCANDHGDLRFYVEHLVEALWEFESNARDLPGVSYAVRTWEGSLFPFIELCRTAGTILETSALEDLIKAADETIGQVERVPCFDAFHQNAVVRSDYRLPHGREIVFLDFDKAFWLVPAGEQLSHVAVFPPTSIFEGEAVSAYASLTGASEDKLRSFVSVASFFRALSGVRDAWKGMSRGSDASQSDQVTARQRVALDCLAFAHRSLPSLSAFLPLPRNHIVSVDQFLDKVGAEVAGHPDLSAVGRV